MLNGMPSSFRPSKKLAEAPEPTSGAFSIMVSSQMANKRRARADSAGNRPQPQFHRRDRVDQPIPAHELLFTGETSPPMNVSTFWLLEVHISTQDAAGARCIAGFLSGLC